MKRLLCVVLLGLLILGSASARHDERIYAVSVFV